MSLKFGQKCQNSSLIKHKELVFNQAFEYCVFQLDLNGSVGGGPSTWFNISWLGLYTVLWSPRLGLGWRTLLVSPGLTIRVQHPSPNLGENGLCIAIYDIIFLTKVFYQNLYISACWYVEISVCTIFLLFHLVWSADVYSITDTADHFLQYIPTFQQQVPEEGPFYHLNILIDRSPTARRCTKLNLTDHWPAGLENSLPGGRNIFDQVAVQVKNVWRSDKSWEPGIQISEWWWKQFKQKQRCKR